MGDAQNKIEELMISFDRILEFCENSSVLNQASEITIKENFVLAASLENFYHQLQRSGCVHPMEKYVLERWKQRGRSVPSEVGVFEESCDLLLTACFRSPSLTCKSLCIAVAEYERLCGNDRLQELVLHLLREGISCQLLHTLASAPPCLLTAVFLGWRNMIECGQSSEVKVLITTALSQTPAHVSSIFQLILKSNDDEDTSMKALLIDCVVTKMKEENSREFCSSLVNSIDATVLVSVAKDYPHFLTALLKDLQTLGDGAELQCKRTEGGGIEYTWKDRGFPVELVQKLCKCEGPVGSRTLSWLSMLQAGPGCSLWEDVAACCGV